MARLSLLPSILLVCACGSPSRELGRPRMVDGCPVPFEAPAARRAKLSPVRFDSERYPVRASFLGKGELDRRREMLEADNPGYRLELDALGTIVEARVAAFDCDTYRALSVASPAHWPPKGEVPRAVAEEWARFTARNADALGIADSPIIATLSHRHSLPNGAPPELAFHVQSCRAPEVPQPSRTDAEVFAEAKGHFIVATRTSCASGHGVSGPCLREEKAKLPASADRLRVLRRLWIFRFPDRFELRRVATIVPPLREDLGLPRENLEEVDVELAPPLPDRDAVTGEDVSELFASVGHTEVIPVDCGANELVPEK